MPWGFDLDGVSSTTFLALKTHANSKIVERFDHGLSP
jgi:hypothetical protein